MMSFSSLFDSTLLVDACSAFSTLPRSGRIAWNSRLRPCFAEPPAESPSTMNSSLSPGSVELQSASLPGRLRRCDTAVLRCTLSAAARDAVRARAARMTRLAIAFACVGLLEQIVLQRRADEVVDRCADLRVVEPILRLPLELRLLDVHAEDGDQPFADVLGGDGQSLRDQILHGEIVAHRLGEAVLQPVLVRAARRRRDAVDERQDAFLGRLGPRERALDDEAVLAVGVERLGDLLLVAVGDQLLDVLGDAAVVVEGLGLLVDLVLEDERQAAMQIRARLEAFADDRRLEGRCSERSASPA